MTAGAPSAGASDRKSTNSRANSPTKKPQRQRKKRQRPMRKAQGLSLLRYSHPGSGRRKVQTSFRRLANRARSIEIPDQSAEAAVAEAIARASNPLRATQSLKEQFEVELNRVAKEKTELEQAYLRAKTEWEQEKLKMAGEMVKLRRAAQIMGRPIPKEDTPEVNPKVRDLENQLHESLNKWNTERTELVAEIHKLQESARLWDTERRQLNDHAGQLQQAFMQAQAALQTHEVAFIVETAPADDKVQELKADNEQLQHQLEEAKSAWDAERCRFEQQLHRMSDTRDRVSNEVVDQLRKQYEEKLQEAISHKTQLAQQLQTASTMLETERARLQRRADRSRRQPQYRSNSGRGSPSRKPGSA